MSEELPSLGGRRAPLPPSPLSAEIVRGRVLDVLEGRFDVPITVLVAGAGFGKTTVLAQAIRANEASPRGVDAWVACEPGDEDAERLAAALLTAIEREQVSGARSRQRPRPVPRRGGEPVDRVLAALSETAPVDVCIVVDDLHELPRMSAGDELIRQLAARLPSNAHLLLASREPLSMPLARRRAADHVVELNVDALAFTDAEITALADLLGGNRASCNGLAGWPSLIRLVLSAPPGATPQFLYEEIVARLMPAEQAGLLALAVLGVGSAAELAAVAASPVEFDRLVGSVPLLYKDAHGRFGAHALWEDAVERIFTVAEVAAVRRRTLQVLAERGETVRMGSAAARWSDAEMFRAACVTLVRDSLGALPIETAARWIARTPPGAVGTPEQRLLELTLRHVQRRADDDLDAELDQLERAFAERGDDHARAVTLALASVVAHAHGDPGRLVQLADRIRVLPGIGRDPLLQFFVDSVDAALASLTGDVAGALRVLESMNFDRAPSLVRELVTRLYVVMLVLAGRADEAVSIATPLLESPHSYVRSMPAMVRWLAGDPTEQLTRRPQLSAPVDLNHRDRVVRAAHGVVVAAALGDRGTVDASRHELTRARASSSETRESTLVAGALAADAVLAHDEALAAKVIADHLERYPLSNRLSEVHLRRQLGVAFVLSEPVRRHWETAALGPNHARSRGAARQLLAARQSRTMEEPLESAAVIVTSLPLPWSVELALRTMAANSPDGASLLRTLSAWVPAATRIELEWFARHGDELCAATATTALSDLPDPHLATVTIEVLGPLRMRVGDRVVTGVEMRRGRVRTLLALLVLRGRLRRDRIGDLLWPDLDPPAAAQNLRVTLSRLRRLLADAEVPPTLRTDPDFIELFGPPCVETDLGIALGHLDAAARARTMGGSVDELAALQQAVELWRGEPLTDLDSVIELHGDVEHIRQSIVVAALRLGELQLVGGRFDDALVLAERARAASPYSERAVRLALACHLQRRDDAGLQATVRSAASMLAELGVEADAATEMLVRRAAARLGAVPDGSA